MKRPAASRLALLYAQLALHRGGVDADRRVMEALAEDEDARAGELLRELAALLPLSNSLADAMGQIPAVFAPPTVALLRAAQAAGRDAGALQLLARDSLWLDRRERETWGGLSYPVMLLLGASALLLLMSVVIIPPFEDALRSFGGQLPALTTGVLALGPVLGSVAVTVLVLWMLRRLLDVRWFDIVHLMLSSALNRVPAWRRYLQIGVEPRILGAMALALRHGLPLAEVAAHLRATSHGQEARILGALEAQLACGVPLGTACLAVPELPRRLGRLAADAEAREQSAEVLERMAELYADHGLEQRDRLRRRATLLVYVVVAVIVALCLIGLYLPIFKLGSIE